MEPNQPTATPANPSKNLQNFGRDRFLKPDEGLEDSKRLQDLLDRYKDKRVLVVAPPGAGKSTLLQHIKEGVDMDIIFDTMPEEAKAFAMQRENQYSDIETRKIRYTQKEYIVGDPQSAVDLELSNSFFTTYVNEHMKIQPGRPVFGTKVIDCDVIVYLKLSDKIYKNRLDSRNKNTNRPEQPEKVFAIKGLIERDVEIAKSLGVIVEEFEVI
jgi:dephospho-CoA kinase